PRRARWRRGADRHVQPAQPHGRLGVRAGDRQGRHHRRRDSAAHPGSSAQPALGLMDRGQGTVTARLAAVDWRSLGVWLAVLALALVALALSPGFLSPRSLLNVLRQAAPLGIIATGITLVMVARRV